MGGESLKAAALGRLQDSGRERRADVLTLPVVADRERDLGVVIVDRGKASEADDFSLALMVVLGDQRQPAAIVDAGQQPDHRVGHGGKRRQKPEISGARARPREEIADAALFTPDEGANAKTSLVRQRQALVEIVRVLSGRPCRHRTSLP